MNTLLAQATQSQPGGIKGVTESTKTAYAALNSFLDQLFGWLPFLAVGMVIIIAAWILASIAGRIARSVLTRTRMRPELAELIGKLSYVLIWVIGILAAAVVATGLSVGQVVATLGLGSIALGFAFKDIIENFLAGIMILWKFPYNEGDFIHCEDIEGKVLRIELRNTQVRQTDGQLIVMPNAMMFTNPVRVLTYKKHRRMTVICGIAYGEDVAEGRRVMREALESCETVIERLGVEVYAQEFASSSINFEVTWWCGSTPLEVRQSRDEVVEKVKKALDDAGIEIPYPYLTLTTTDNEPGIMHAMERATIAARGNGDNGNGDEGGGNEGEGE